MAWLFPILEKFLPFVAHRLFVHIFFTPARYPLPEKEQPFVRSAVKTSINFRNRKVQVYQWGSGRPVLMMHGWMGRATQFRKFIPELNAAGFSIVSFDAPAHGKSEGVKSHLMYFVEVAHLLMKKYDFEAVIGHSLGGVAGLHLLKENTGSKKLVMIGSPTIADDIIGEFIRRLKASWISGEYFKEYIKKSFGIPFEHFSASHVIKQVEGLPIYLIYDADDIEVPLKHGEALKKLYPAAEIHVTEGLGHTRILRDDEVIERTLSFIKQ